MMFRPRGVLTSDSKYASPARIVSVEEMLQHRDTWMDPPCPGFDFESILAAARSEEPLVVKPLVRTDKGYHPIDLTVLSTVEKIARFTQSSLNKLTEANFDAIVEPCLSREILTPETIPTIVDQIFSKALEESLFASLYARFAMKLAAFEHDQTQTKEVRKSIVARSQMTFEESLNLQFKPTDSEEERAKIRKKKLANITFIGELYRSGLLTDRIIHSILHHIMNGPLPSDVEVEIVVLLLLATGKLLEERSQEVCKIIFQRLQVLVEAHSARFSKIVLFRMMNLLDMRAKGWVKKEAETVKEGLQFLPPVPPSVAARTLSDSSWHLRANELPPKLAASGVREIVELICVSAAESDIATAENNLSQSLKLLSEVTQSRPLIAYTVANHACSINDTAKSLQIFALLRSSLWGTNHESYKGMAWCIATGVLDNILEDVPRYYTRFAANVTHFVMMHNEQQRVCGAFCGVVKHVFGHAASMLNDARAEHEGDSSWEETYVKNWELFLDEVKNRSCPAPKANAILDAMSSIPASQFLSNVYPDVLFAMIKRGFCTQADLLKWKQENQGDTGKLLLVRQISDVIIDS